MKLHICFLFLLSLLLNSAFAGKVIDIRTGTHDEYDRVVIELNSEPDARFFSPEPGTVVLDLYQVDSNRTLPAFDSNLKRIGNWKSEFHSEYGIYRIYFKVSDAVSWKSMILKDPNRLVVDFTSTGIPQSSSAPVRASSDSVTLVSSTNVVQSGFRPRTIIIDPGHGGHHRGGVGSVNGKRVTEADVTPPIAKYLDEYLRADPMFTTKLTRQTDTYIGLRERTAMAENWNGQLFVSIHYNSLPAGRNPRSARGLEFWTWSPKESDSAVSKYLTKLNNEENSSADVGNPRGQAASVLNQMVSDALLKQATESLKVANAFEDAFLRDSYFKANYRGIKSARFKVLENYNMPSVLVEVGFISHPDEAKKALDSTFQRTVARHLYEGIVRYYEQHDPDFQRARAIAKAN